VWLFIIDFRLSNECRVIELMDKIGEQGNNPHAYIMSLLYENDLQTMYQVAEYVRCGREEISKDPKGQVDAMLRWHLMHCGYDPLKKKSTL
jgi:DNA-binding phage protein